MTDIVPETWEPAEPDPPPARPLRWWWVPLAALGVLIIPRRLGPALASGGLFKALTVHAVMLLLTVAGLILVFEWDYMETLLTGNFFGPRLFSWQTASWSERARLPFALFVSFLIERNWGSAELVIVLAILGGFHALCWLLAYLLFPFASGGRSWASYVRLLKLTWWSTTALLPLVGVAVIMVLLLVEQYVIGGFAATVIVLVWLNYWLNLQLRLALHAGVAPSREPQAGPTPRCNGCGYRLTGLPTDGRCPECGLPVERSLPTHRHRPHWALHRRALFDLVAYARTARRVYFQPTYFDQLAVHSGRADAVRFAVLTSWMLGLWAMLLVGLPLVALEAPEWPEAVLMLITPAAVTALALWLILALLALVACRGGARDPRPTSTTLGYASICLLPGLCAIPVGLWASVGVTRDDFLHLLRPLPGHVSFYEGLLVSTIIACVVVTVAWGVIRMRHAFRATRFAAA